MVDLFKELRDDLAFMKRECETWYDFEACNAGQVSKLLEAFDVLYKYAEQMEAGYAGMFGSQSLKPQEDCWERGCDMTTDALERVRELEKDV